jgi:hypothetical protein
MKHLCGKGCAMQALERFMTPKAANVGTAVDIRGAEELASRKV